MCMIDYADEPVLEISCYQPKARTKHRCEECRREILPGEHYERFVGKFDGELCVYKTCLHCVAVRQWLRYVCSGWIYSAVREDLLEHFREGYGFWLGRAAVGMKKKWRRRDGLMLAPMKLPTELPVVH